MRRSSAATLWISSCFVCLVSSKEMSFSDWVLAARQQESDAESIAEWWRLATGDVLQTENPATQRSSSEAKASALTSVFRVTPRIRQPVLKDHRAEIRPKKRSPGCGKSGKGKSKGRQTLFRGDREGCIYEGDMSHTHKKGKAKAKKVKSASKHPSHFGKRGKGGASSSWHFFDAEKSPKADSSKEKNKRISIYMKPTNTPTVYPTTQIVLAPTQRPTLASSRPTTRPSLVHSSAPSLTPSYQPSIYPTLTASEAPSLKPSKQPSTGPTGAPSYQPTEFPSRNPTESPSKIPSATPSDAPTRDPSSYPSQIPTEIPTTTPTHFPSNPPSAIPTMVASDPPTMLPTVSPSLSIEPSLGPSALPSSKPSTEPSSYPSVGPSSTAAPTATVAPSLQPSLSGDFARVSATPFNLEYTVSASLPGSVDGTSARDVTAEYLKGFLATQLSFNQDADLRDVVVSFSTEGEVASDNLYVTPVNVVFQFEKGGILPKQPDVDVLVFTAFSPPFVQQLLAQLGALGDGLFSTTNLVVYTPLS